MILLTGAVGNIGAYTAQHLKACGYDLLATDIVAEENIPEHKRPFLEGINYQQLDILKFDEVLKACKGVEQIIHLAAIPHYVEAKTNQTFHINVGGTYNMYEAAEKLGIKRVLVASSINWLGNGFGHHWIDINYLPIDEKHPGFVTDTYGFSKTILEQTADYFWCRAQISSLCYRFPLVHSPFWLTEQHIQKIFLAGIEDFEWLASLAAVERVDAVQRIKAEFLAQRSRRIRGELNFFDLIKWMHATQGGMMMWGYENFWAWLHVYDAARTLEHGLRADFSGSHPLYVAEPINCLGLPIQALIELFYPTLELRKELAPQASLLDLTAAQQLLNFHPEWSAAALFKRPLPPS